MYVGIILKTPCIMSPVVCYVGIILSVKITETRIPSTTMWPSNVTVCAPEALENKKEVK